MGWKPQRVIADTRLDIERALKDKRAFDVKTAADLQVANLDLVPVLDIMEKRGLNRSHRPRVRFF